VIFPEEHDKSIHKKWAAKKRRRTMDIQKTEEKGSNNAQQTAGLNDSQRQSILFGMEELKKHIARLKVESEEKSSLEAEVRTIEAQIDSPKPKASILDESLGSMRAILEVAEVKAPKIISAIANIENLLGA